MADKHRRPVNDRAKVKKHYFCNYNHDESQQDINGQPYVITSPDDESEEYIYDTIGDMLLQVYELSKEGHTVTVNPYI